MAREEAERFAKLALIERDFEKAYDIYSANQKSRLPLDQFRMLIDKLHPRGFPSIVTATDFEPVAEAKGLIIYLYGENGDQKFYYHFSMEGTEKTGYKVAGVWRDDGPSRPKRVTHQKVIDNTPSFYYLSCSPLSKNNTSPDAPAVFLQPLGLP